MVAETIAEYKSSDNLDDMIRLMEAEMKKTADELDFEKATKIRDRIKKLKETMVLDF
ncbi:MAG: UvrB/UvrC motif-containing protein, partial [Deltaproteobacteria bacterium]|nr:UvrB/UvrC motif-containing protein [Deltaproteobacteria bacterium]